VTGGRPTGRYFEDFSEGQAFVTAGRTLYRADIVSFTNVAGIHEELYTNNSYIAEQSLYGRAFAPGPLTFCLSEGLVIQLGLFEKTGLALLEASMKFESPWFLEDTIAVTVRVDELRPTSRPDRGIIFFTHEVDTLHGVRVMTLAKRRLVRCRPEPAAES
jgi:acyl dehydratase